MASTSATTVEECLREFFLNTEDILKKGLHVNTKYHSAIQNLCSEITTACGNYLNGRNDIAPRVSGTGLTAGSYDKILLMKRLPHLEKVFDKVLLATDQNETFVGLRKHVLETLRQFIAVDDQSEEKEGTHWR